MTVNFCCGFECGIIGTWSPATLSPHWVNFDSGADGRASLSTSIVRSGARSLKVDGTGQATVAYVPTFSSQVLVARFYVYFNSTLSGITQHLFSAYAAATGRGAVVLINGTIYAGSSSLSYATPGVAVTTGQWYRIDFKVNTSNNPHTIDVSVNGSSCTQHTEADVAETLDYIRIGNIRNASGVETYFDDVAFSVIAGDYPIGPGYVAHFVPTSDGTHNVAGANDFEQGTTGVDITNATTTAYQLVDDVPLPTGTPTDDSIGIIAPPNSTDYVEMVMGPAPGVTDPSVAPRAMSLLHARHMAGTGSCNYMLIYNSVAWTNFTGAGTTSFTYVSNNITSAYLGIVTGDIVRVGRSNDANPDIFIDGIMVEAEFAPATSIKTWHGLAHDSTKTVMGLTEASAKTGQGLA